MKHSLAFLCFVSLFGPVFGQPPSSFDYESIMKSHRGLVEDFMEAQEQLSTAGSNYVATIESVFSSEGQSTKGPNSGNTKYQQRQVERMIHVVPVFVSVAENKEELMQRIDSWVNGFCKEFGLPYEQEKGIRQGLIRFKIVNGQRSSGAVITGFNEPVDVVGTDIDAQ